ncbi:MAG: histidinol-phosphate transaminase [Sphingobium sp.]
MNDVQTLGRPQPKSWIAALSPYVPGKASNADGRPVVKLSANENPLGTGDAARAAFAEGSVDLASYPDPAATGLREAIAARHGLDPERVICGTGSDELLHVVAGCYAGPGDEIVYVRYGFAVYDIAARRVGAVPIIAPDHDYGTDVDALLACVTDSTRLVFVANPNNPTGTMSSREEIARLHAGLPSHVVLVLDQAYAEYLEPEDEDGGLALAREASNVLVTRTFSKIHGLAAERVGWAYGASGIIENMHRIRGPFNVTTAGQAAAVAAMADEQWVARSRDHNRQWRQWFSDEVAAMGNLGLSIVPSKANFVLTLFKGRLTAQAAFEGLMQAGYATRWLPGQDLPDGLRITVGSEAHMRDVARLLRDMAERA